MKQFIDRYSYVAVLLFILMFSVRHIDRAVLLKTRSQTLTEIHAMQSTLSDVEARIGEAKKKHPKYTQSLSIGNALEDISREEDRLSKVRLLSTNATPLRYAVREAKQVLERTKSVGKEVDTRIAYLDQALEQYQRVEPRIRGEAAEIEKKIKFYTDQGYFSRHFTGASSIRSQILDSHSQVTSLLKNISPVDMRPDYVAIFEMGQKGLDLKGQALAQIEAVPQLRQFVANKIAELSASRQRVLNAYQEAFRSARRIESYQAYRKKGYSSTLEDWQRNTTFLLESLGEVERLNSMEVQDFSGANKNAERIESSLSSAVRVIGQVNSFDQKVRDAARNLDYAHRQAEREISRAQSYIDEWRSENDQSEAESTLSSARSKFRSAGYDESSDPVEAQSEYESARSYAQRAYDEVDTQVDPPPTSNTDSGSGTSGFDSSSSSSYGGGYDSGGSSSFPSSSGGMSGGSIDSGPSGGSVGDGD